MSKSAPRDRVEAIYRELLDPDLQFLNSSFKDVVLELKESETDGIWNSIKGDIKISEMSTSCLFNALCSTFNHLVDTKNRVGDKYGLYHKAMGVELLYHKKVLKILFFNLNFRAEFYNDATEQQLEDFKHMVVITKREL